MDCEADSGNSPKLKGLHQYSDDELLDVLSNAKEDEVSKELEQISDIPHFISFFKLEFGNNRINVKILHNLYSAWGNCKLTRSEFVKEMNLHLPSELYGGARYYLLNSESFVVTGKTRELLQERKLDKRKSRHSRSHFEQFLKHHKITPGDYWIELDNVYYLYKNWIKSTGNRNKFSEQVFRQFCYLYFKKKLDRRDWTWIQVNPSILKHISIEKIEQLRFQRKENVRLYGKKNKKKSH